MGKRIALVVLAGLALAAFLWFGRDPAPPREAVRRGAADQPYGVPVAAEAKPLDDEPGGVVRKEAGVPDKVPASVDEATGSLRIHVVHHGGEAAPGIHLYLARFEPGVPMQPLARMVSDAHGDAQVDALPVGKVRLSCDRGANREISIAAGTTAEVTLELPDGIEVAGVVQDQHGVPVAGASIWLTSFQSPWMAGAVVARSGADGSFALHAVPPTQSLGALSPGRAPSALVDLELQDTAHPLVHIVLVVGDAGGMLVGRVTDSAGKPAAGALVAIGSSTTRMHSRSSGTTIETWSPRVALTDQDGRYQVDSLAPGKQDVEVWGRGSPFWHGDCTLVAGGQTVLDVQLADGVTVTGIVRDADRKPMADAIVRAFPTPIGTDFLQAGQYDYDSIFGHPYALADAGGRYRLRAVAPGKVHLFAGPLVKRSTGEPVPWAETMMDAAPGASLQWDPIVEEGPSIAGVVRYHDGEPMANHFVTALEPGTNRRQSLTTDKTGHFRFLHLERKPYDLAVQYWSAPKGAPPLGAREVWPDTGEVVLVADFDSPKKLARGSVRGEVADAAHRLGEGTAISVILNHEDRSWNVNPDLKGSAFTFKNVEPGRHRVIVMAGESPVLAGEWFELQPAEHKDLGTLVTEPGGALHLHIERGAGTAEMNPSLYVTQREVGHGRKVELGSARELDLDNLSAGEYRMSGYAEGMVTIDATAQVVAGEVRDATISLQAGVKREIVFDYEAAQQLLRIQVTDVSGRSYLDSKIGVNLPRPYPRTIHLPIGSFTASVETVAGTASTSFEVTALRGNQPSVHVQAR